MSIQEHLTEFAGRPVEEWTGQSVRPGVCYRITLSQEEAEGARPAKPAPAKPGFFSRLFGQGAPPAALPEAPTWTSKFEEFLAQPGVNKVEGLVVGDWNEAAQCDPAFIVAAMVDAKAELAGLKAIFLGDIVMEECEISWIQQTNISPLIQAFPALESFGVRGGEALAIEPLRHEQLRQLIIQTGGLDADVVQGLCRSQLPALEHLELWLGTEQYGANVEIRHLQPILDGKLFPKLRHLALSNSHKQDEIAAAIAVAPVLNGLRVLDLSKGTLTDAGASALERSPAIRKLEKLDLHYHYLSEAKTKEMAALGIPVDVSDRQEPEEENYRYVAVSE